MLEFLAGGAVGALLSGRNTYRETTRLVPYEKTVHEHRAPTDESIKLLREMEEKSRKQIACALVAENNIVNGAVVQFYDEHMRFEKVCYVSYQLNGQQMEHKIALDGRVMMLKEQAIDILFQNLAGAITAELLKRLRL